MNGKTIGTTVAIVLATIIVLNIIKPNLPAGIRRLFSVYASRFSKSRQSDGARFIEPARSNCRLEYDSVRKKRRLLFN